VEKPFLSRIAVEFSGFGLMSFGVEQTHASNLPSIHKVPIRPYPDYEELSSSSPGHREMLGMPHRQRFTIG